MASAKRNAFTAHSVRACLPFSHPRPPPCSAAALSFEAQGEGHVAEVIDGRSFRLGDGREIKLTTASS